MDMISHASLAIALITFVIIYFREKREKNELLSDFIKIRKELTELQMSMKN